jgi:hypothetical protein
MQVGGKAENVLSPFNIIYLPVSNIVLDENNLSF